MKKISLFYFLIVALYFGLTACTQKKLSERDRKLQDQQQKVDLKKSELEPLTGVYMGKLLGDNDHQQNIKLTLDIREIPETAGETDPVLIPRLVGSIRFLYGSEEDNEYIDAGIKSAEFIKLTQQLSLVVAHHQFNEMVLSGKADGSQIIGQWNAATLGVQGTFTVNKLPPSTKNNNIVHIK